jgi:hypothetical protein
MKYADEANRIIQTTNLDTAYVYWYKRLRGYDQSLLNQQTSNLYFTTTMKNGHKCRLIIETIHKTLPPASNDNFVLPNIQR